MRNVFDQYTQDENRITHALLTALNEDRALLRRFLKELVRVTSPVCASALQILEQRLPGEQSERSDVQAERRGVPDGWIFSEEHGWCILLESKVQAHPTNRQIRSHRARARSKGFHTIIPLVITVVRPDQFDSADVTVIEWRAVYGWLRERMTHSDWAGRVVDFLETMEERMIEGEKGLDGTLTTFTGFPFSKDNPLTYLEAKRCLRLAMDELRTNEELQQRLSMVPDSGRPAITRGEDNTVWDFLSLTSPHASGGFTSFLHLTLGVTPAHVEAMVTIPHGVHRNVLKSLRALGESGFRDLVGQVLAYMKGTLPDQSTWVPAVRAMQRRYPSQWALPYVDARLDFDLRTALDADGPPKTQPVWLTAAYEVLSNKRGANYQVQIGVVFPFRTCRAIATAEATALLARSWLACTPLVELARGTEPPA